MNLLDKIKKYEAGVMTSQEKALFEESINTNPNVFEELEMFRMQNLLIEAADRRDTRNKMREWHEELFPNEKPDSPKVVPFWKKAQRLIPAAAAIIGLLIGAVLFIFSEETKGQKYFAQSEEELLFNLRNGEQDTFLKLISLLKTGDDREIAQTVEAFKSKKKENSGYAYYEGVGLFKLEKYAESINVFDEFLNPKNKNPKAMLPNAEFCRLLAVYELNGKNTFKKEADELIERKKGHAFEKEIINMMKELF